MIPLALKLRPRRALIWVEMMVIATAEVKPDITGVEIKLTIKPEKYVCTLHSE
jgi:hypothetical protein